MSDLPAVREDLSPQQRIVEAVRQPAMREQLEVALPEGVNVDRFVRVAVTALREQPALAECDPDSVMAAVIRCAQDGLLPDGREAALVKRGVKASYMPMVGGFRKIAAEYGWTITSAAVRDNDVFEHELGENPRIVHRPPRLGQDRGELIGAYAIAEHRDGRRMAEVMDRGDVERARKKATTQAVWNEWTDRMYEKTPTRRLFKKLPLGDPERQARVAEAEEALPADAAAQLYGETARAALEGPSAASPLPAAAEAPETPPAETSRGTSAPAEADASAGSGGKPFDGEEPTDGDELVVELDIDFGPEAGASVVEQAGAVVIDAGRYEGQTIASVYALGEVGQKYLRWAAGSWEPGRIKDAVITWNANHPKED